MFGVGFGLAMVMAIPFALVFGCLLLSLAAGAAGHREAGQNAIAAIFLLVFVPLVLAMTIDRRLGERLSPTGLPGRAVRGLLGLYHRAGLVRGSNTLLSVFQSNEGRLRTGVLIFVMIFSASLFTIGQLLADRGDLDYGDFAGLPDDDPTSDDTVFAAHYASLRGSDAFSPNPVPVIPDRLVKGPYLELFVPYRARQAAAALRLACPQQVEQAGKEGGAARPALDCLAKLLDVRIDGQPVAAPLDASTDPATAARGALAMIPVQALAPGRHVVTLQMPRLPRASEKGPAKLQRIPFWK